MLTMRYAHTDGRTFTLTYERFSDGWCVTVTDLADPDGFGLYYDDWRSEFASDVVEPDPTRTFRTILSHHLDGATVDGPWQSLNTDNLTVTMGGTR